MAHIESKYKEFLYTILALGVLGAVTIIIMMGSPLNPLSKGKPSGDSSVFKYVALVMSRGGMPYKDVFDHKGPLLYIINYLGLLISYYRGLWVIECIFMFAFLTISYFTARLFSGKGVSLLLVILCASSFEAYFIGGNFTEEFALPFIAGGIYIFIDYFINSRISRTRLVICGLCLGCVLMLRINIAAIWIVFPIGVLIKCIWGKSKEWISFLLWFLVGMAIVILPILLWLITNGAFSDFIYDYIIFNLKYTSTTDILNKYNSLVHFLDFALLLVGMAINLWMILKIKEQRFFNTTYFIAIIVTLTAVAMSGRFSSAYSHYGLILIPLLIYPYAWLFGSNVNEIGSNKLLLSVLLTLLVFNQWQSLGQTAVTKFQNYLDNKYDTFSQEQKTIIKLINDNTTEDDKIITIGNNDCFWYVYCKRLAASKYAYQYPPASVDKDIIEEFLDDIRNNTPKIAIVNGDYKHLFERIDDYDCVYKNNDDTLSVYVLLE